MGRDAPEAIVMIDGYLQDEWRYCPHCEVTAPSDFTVYDSGRPSPRCPNCFRKLRPSSGRDQETASKENTKLPFEKGDHTAYLANVTEDWWLSCILWLAVLKPRPANELADTVKNTGQTPSNEHELDFVPCIVPLDDFVRILRSPTKRGKTRRG